MAAVQNELSTPLIENHWADAPSSIRQRSSSVSSTDSAQSDPWRNVASSTSTHEPRTRLPRTPGSFPNTYNFDRYRPAPPSPKDEKRQYSNMLRGYGAVAANLATIGVSAAAVSVVAPAVGSTASVVALVGLAAVQIGSSLNVNLHASPTTRRACSFLMHAAAGASFGLLLPALPPVLVVNALVATVGITMGLLMTTAALPTRYFDNMRGPLCAAVVGTVILTTAELFLPAHLGAFGVLGLANSLLGIGIGMGLIAFESSRMAKAAKQPSFDPVVAGAQLSMGIFTLFLNVLDYLLKSEARQQRRS